MFTNARNSGHTGSNMYRFDFSKTGKFNSRYLIVCRVVGSLRSPCDLSPALFQPSHSYMFFLVFFKCTYEIFVPPVSKKCKNFPIDLLSKTSKQATE